MPMQARTGLPMEAQYDLRTEMRVSRASAKDARTSPAPERERVPDATSPRARRYVTPHHEEDSAHSQEQNEAVTMS
jgi:hypothetical protein